MRNLRRVEVQPLIDKISKRLPGWKGKFLSSEGREMLDKSVLSSQQVYHLTVFSAKNGSSSKLTYLEEASFGKETNMNESMGVIVW